jgi:uncharacterized lipoprotein YddW (UPF0748 family)
MLIAVNTHNGINMKNISSKQAYELLVKKAKKKGMTVNAWCVKCGVSRSLPSQWKKRTDKVYIETAVKLGII